MQFVWFIKFHDDDNVSGRERLVARGAGRHRAAAGGGSQQVGGLDLDRDHLHSHLDRDCGGHRLDHLDSHLDHRDHEALSRFLSS